MRVLDDDSGMKVLDDDYGPPRCQECGERFMGEARAEVVMRDVDPEERKVVHAGTCYDEERMVLA